MTGAVLGALALVASCASDSASSTSAPAPISASASGAPATSPTSTTTAAVEPSTTPTDVVDPVAASATFTAQVWADNWFALFVNGQQVGEDSVPITTERSFNAETVTFTASYPLTIGMITKDFKETDSGLEYIGTDRQQMGDGGFIAQITDTATGAVVAASGTSWRGLVIQRAPLNVECETSSDPDTECRSESVAEPAGWAEPTFDDSAWTPATVYTADEVGAKDGYATITWDPSAALIWTSSLTMDNTILWRAVVTG